MGQAANSGRSAKLDQKKVRAAGRQQNPRSPKGDLPLGRTAGSDKRAGGAHGKDGHVRKGMKASALTRGGGGGGAAFSVPKD
jgi:hypothetical protein